jgi:AcrR family transcriptional regulator
MIALRQDVIMSQTERDRPSVLRAARERTRAEITREILDAARRHLATDGAAGLGLRAIARELGVSSSAVYGYVASRDELLTRLIVAAYDALGSAAETQEAAMDREDLAGRWAAVCGAVRGWALANPNEYALIYGTPVPGYIAPAATIALAARVSSVLLGILRDIAAGHTMVRCTTDGCRSAWYRPRHYPPDATPSRAAGEPGEEPSSPDAGRLRVYRNVR